MKANLSSLLLVLAMLACLASAQLQDLPQCGVRTSYLSANSRLKVPSVSIANTLVFTVGLHRRCRPQLDLFCERHTLYLRQRGPPGSGATMRPRLLYCSRAAKYAHLLAHVTIQGNPGVDISL